MDYSIGSVADLISGSITPNKQKVVKKQFKMQRKSLGNVNQVEISKGKSSQNKKANKVKDKKRRNSAPPKIKQIKKNEDISEDEQSDTFDLQDMFKNNPNRSDTMESIDDLLKINEDSGSANDDIPEENAVKKSLNKKLKRKSLNNSGQEEVRPPKAKLTGSDNEDILEENAVKKSPNKKLKCKSLNNSGQEEVSPPKAKLTKKEKKTKAKKINNIELADNTNGQNSDNETSTAGNEVEAEAIVKSSKKIKRDKKQKLKRKISNDSEEVNAVPAKKKLKKEKMTPDNLSLDDSNSETSDDENEKKPPKKFEEPNPNHVTIFVGNLPLSTTKHQLKKLFSKFGNVENARIRGIPVEDLKIPKKVAAIKKQFHKDRTSAHGYVTFSEREPAEKALSYNGKEYKDHHIRVNIANVTPDVNKDKAIFLGNVSFEAEEEELWKLFESCGEIESVRLVRDRRTNVGKGFGYVNFKSSDSVELALQMGEVKLKDRVLRISLYNTKAPKKQNKPQPQKGENSEKNVKRKKFFLEKKNPNKAGNNTKEQFQGKIATTEKKKKFNKGKQQKKNLAKKVAPRTMSG